MWESCKIEKKEFLLEREQEQESFEEEVDSKVGGGEDRLDQINGVTSTESIDDGRFSPSKQQQQQKKKKPLLCKFGSLLKKNSTSNQKKRDQFWPDLCPTSKQAGRFTGYCLAPKCV
ncbi:unnamed protein product [Prunus armeniaca]